MSNENENKHFRIRTRGKPTRFYIDNELVERASDLGLSQSHIAIYCALARHAHSRDQSGFPSWATIMAESGVGSVNTLRKCLGDLEQKNLI